MLNKQIPQPRKDKSSLYRTQQSKSQSRYPLQQLDDNFNKVQVYSPHKKYKGYNKINFNQVSKDPNMSLFQSINNSGVSVSVRERCRMLQINTVHELIASARSKKSQIEDLLRQEQLKAEMQDLEQAQATASLRKLKKVVRLMQIVCKIILGRNEQNSYIDVNTQQDISMRQMQSFSMQNYQRELANKNSQILRLKKFVQILSVPNRELSHSLINSNSNSTIMDSVRNSLEQHQFDKEIIPKVDAFVQTEQICQGSQDRINHKTHENKKINNKFLLCQEYSLWNILDAQQNKQMQPQPIVFQSAPIPSIQKQQLQEKLPIKQSPLVAPHQNRSLKLTQTHIHPIQIDAKCAFIKRFKSIVKITLNAINLCNNIFLRAQRTNQVASIASDILELTNYFNKKYHSHNGYYDDDFCKQIKDKINSLYERVHRIYKQANIDQQIFDCFL